MESPPNQYSPALMQAVLGSLREGILVIDQDTNIVLYNQAASEIFKLRLQDASGRLLRLVDATRNKTIHQGFRKVLQDGTPFEGEVEFLNSQTRTYSFRATPLLLAPGNTVNGAIGVFSDISQLVKLERVRREFFANLSHELRTPLTSILVYVETLLDGAIYDIDYNVEFLQIINKHGKRMLNLVKDIADLSAIEGGEVSITLTDVDLKAFVENLATLVSAEVEEQNLTFTNAVPAGIRVFADTKSLEQVLMNLIVNAIRFNRPKGSITLSARLEDPEHVVITVKDTGIGMDAHHLPRIFERLYRVDKSRSQETGGTGLGLAIVKHLVHTNHGDISVESTPNEGTSFHIKLLCPPQA
ncbi:MAG: PAS domain-containing protein [Acidobacteria bacterium]|nr:PAS domain-containing protein [Acidobacteriota bacterium]